MSKPTHNLSTYGLIRWCKCIARLAVECVMPSLTPRGVIDYTPRVLGFENERNDTADEAHSEST